MGTVPYLELLPRKPVEEVSRDAIAGALDLLHEWSGKERGGLELAVTEPGSENEAQTWPETFGDAAGAVRGMEWDRVGSLRLVQKGEGGLERLFRPKGAKEEKPRFDVRGVRLTWDPSRPREFDPTAGSCSGYLPQCRFCSRSRPIALSNVLHVFTQEDRWKCPNCGEVAGVNWIDDAETLAFSAPFALGFRGPDDAKDPERPSIRRRKFAESLERSLGFSVREWLVRETK